MRTLLSTFALVAFTSAIPGVVWGQLITFESLPDSTPVTDGMLITTQYAAAFGVTSSFSAFPRGPDRGSPRWAPPKPLFLAPTPRVPVFPETTRDVTCLHKGRMLGVSS